jgi:hypothetical protein
MNTTKFSIEWRDKNGNLKGYIHPFVSNVSWEWNRFGGCGHASFTIKKEYREITFEARDDIQIRVPNTDGTTKLVYRGYVQKITPTLKSGQEIKIDVYGYFSLLKKMIVHNTGDKKNYANLEISEIVDDMVDSFVVTNTPITKGTIDAGTFEVDTIDFLTDVASALDTLATLDGEKEYGVDENLVFFWRTEDETVRHKFFVGDNIVSLERGVDWSKLVNRIYLIGGDVAGTAYKKTGENTYSQDLYYLSEDIVNNSSITSDAVADQYIGALITEKSNPVYNIKAKIINTPIRVEDNIPLGVVAFYDSKWDRDSVVDDIGDIIGETADGGSDIIVGLTADGGSNVTIGGSYSAQINRITYGLPETEGRFNITIELGDTILETAAKIKKLEHALSNLNAA